MMQKIGMTLLCAGGLYTTSAFSLTHNMFAPSSITPAYSYHVSILLSPNESRRVPPVSWPNAITATCTFSSKDNEMMITMVNNSATFTTDVETQEVNQGGKYTVPLISQGGTLKVSADANAIIKFKNASSTNTIDGQCEVNL